MKKKPVVRYVDDLPGNLEKFESDHPEFKVREFTTTGEVLAALLGHFGAPQVRQLSDSLLHQLSVK